jgi:hypothetical protein
MRFQRTSILAGIGLLAVLGVSTPSNAAMLAYQTFNGADLSTDGFGPKGGSLSANVPVGSHVVAAYLYKQGAAAGSAGSLGGSPISFGGLGGSNPPPYARADVTAALQAIVDGSSGPNISISSDDADHENLVVVYNDPNQPVDPGKNVKVVAGGGPDACDSDASLTCEEGSEDDVATDAPPSNGNITESLVVSIEQVEQPNQVPEPATLAIFGAGLLGLGAIRRRLKKA